MIIGFSGKIGTGKSTIAGHLITMLNNANIHADRLAFADSVKIFVSKIYDFPIDWAYNNKGRLVEIPRNIKPEFVSPEWQGMHATVRQIMQFYGTDVIRKRDPDFWIKQAEKTIKNYTKIFNTKIVVIDDVRFKNELEFVQEHGICYRLAEYSGMPVRKNQHVSETELKDSDFDCVLRPQYGKLDIMAEFICKKNH